MSNRWRQENYFRYARENSSLDALDSYAGHEDDLTRLVPNPAKARAIGQVAGARADLSAAQADMTQARDSAVTKAGKRGKRGIGGKATFDPEAGLVLREAQADLTAAKRTSRNTATHLPLGQVRPGSRRLETERKLLTHATRMSAYNSESALARLLRPHFDRGDDEARTLLREAFTLSGNLQIIGDTLHIRLDPASAPRQSKALAALCTELTATATRYPGTDLTLAYNVKGHPEINLTIPPGREFKALPGPFVPGTLPRPPADIQVASPRAYVRRRRADLPTVTSVTWSGDFATVEVTATVHIGPALQALDWRTALSESGYQNHDLDDWVPILTGENPDRTGFRRHLSYGSASRYAIGLPA